MFPSNTKTRPHRTGFTLIELAVILAVVSTLASLVVISGIKNSRQLKRAQCASNLQQFNLAIQIYGNEYDGKLPMFFASGGNWAWDLPSAVGSFVESTSSKWTVMYCPGTDFTESDNRQLYQFWSPSFRVIGYANTFPGNASLLQTNINITLVPGAIQTSPFNFIMPLPSERVLLADGTISNSGQNNQAQRYNYQYTGIQGGFYKPHVSPHLSGRFPMGGNVAMLDGHVAWRQFKDMQPRTTGFSPVFWW